MKVFIKKKILDNVKKTKGKSLLVFVTTEGESRKIREKNSSTPVKGANFRSCSKVVPEPPELHIKNYSCNKTT